jgi:hypothetical protein
LRSRLLAAIVPLAALALAGPAAAAESSWTVEPSANHFGAGRQDYGYTLNPGATLEDGIVIVNDGTSPLRLALRAADARTTPDGQLELVAKPKPAGVGTWLRLDRADVTVPAGKSVEVPFAVTLPDDAAPGDYVGGIVTDAGARVDIGVRLRVGGALKPSLAVEQLHVDYADTVNPLGKGDATVSYTIRNTGNATVAARQTASVSGPFGRWAVAAGGIADTPPLLPGETWKVTAPLEGVAPAALVTAKVTLVPLLADAAGSTSQLTAVKTSGHAVIVPWALLVAILILCGLVAGLVRSVQRGGVTERRRIWS